MSSEITQPQFSQPAIRVSGTSKMTMRGMAFLLKHNLMGKMGAQMMVIQVKGRKSGKAYETPIGYLRDGDAVIALTDVSGQSNWYRNIFAHPDVTLTIQGKTYAARAEPITDETERQRIFAIYKAERADSWKYLFDAPLNSDEATLQAALAKRAFVKFNLQHDS